MAFGGGTFITQNKKLPGTYINFVSAANASANLSDRGVVTMPLELNWGVDNAIFTVTQGEFIKDSLKIFGYGYDAPELKGLRDLFINAQTLHAYKLTSGGDKAENTYATAKYCGTRGNDLKIVVAVNADDSDKKDVSTFLGTVLVDKQTVTTAADLVANDFVTFKSGATLTVTAGAALEGGTNGTVNGTAHQAYLDLIESYTYNTMGVVTVDATTLNLYVAFVKRMRDDVGAKFQLVVHNKPADYEGVINVKNAVADTGWSAASLVYWVTGAEGACAVNATCSNKLYNGEFTVNVNYTQAQLEGCVDAGEFVLHRVGDDIRVLTDINSLVTVTDVKGDDFKANQTIRVLDQIGNDVAVIFNGKYLGQVPNDADGRASLWGDITKLFAQLNDIRAIENFEDGDIQVSAGDTKKAVVIDSAVMPVNAMEKLYMTVKVS